MTNPLPVKVNGICRFNADHEYPHHKDMDGEIVIIRSIDEEREDFQYWVETVNNSKTGQWEGTWAARRELRKMPIRRAK